MSNRINASDPFKFFESHAFAQAKKCQFPADFIHEALAIIKGAFGDSWLKEQSARLALGSFLPDRDHPLGGCFATAGEPQIVEVLELAIYIKRLIKASSLIDVLISMKDKYAPGFLQLAYAYRFQRAGATEITLEPEAHAGRKADISFRYANAEYLVECYIPKIAARDSSQELGYSKDAFFDAIPQNVVMRICIKLKRPIDAVDRKRIERTTTRIIHEMKAVKFVSAEDDAAIISAEDISNIKNDNDFPDRLNTGSMKLYGEATWGITKQMVPRSEIDSIRSGKDYKRGHLSRLFVWQAPEESATKSEEIKLKEFEKKISEKLAQTRRADNPRRIIVATLPDVTQKDENLKKWLAKLQQRIMIKHDRVASLLMTYRVWTTLGRYQYRGVWLGGKPEYCLPEEFYKKVSQYETNLDILQDWT